MLNNTKRCRCLDMKCSSYVGISPSHVWSTLSKSLCKHRVMRINLLPSPEDGGDLVNIWPGWSSVLQWQGPGPHSSAPPASVIRNGNQRTGRGGRAKENIF